MAARLAGIDFALVLTSPRRRASDTCALAGLDGRAEVTDDLAEWDYGAYEGRTTTEIRREVPNWTIFSHGVPDGETAGAVAARADRVIERAARRRRRGGALLARTFPAGPRCAMDRAPGIRGRPPRARPGHAELPRSRARTARPAHVEFVTARSMPPVRSRTVTELMARRGHEQVVFVADADAGLRAVIAVHSTALGPSLGGVRFCHYENDNEALADALRLSEAMSLKAAMAGLHQGGGKAVVQWDDPDRARPPALLAALGHAIDDLGGRYLAAEDVGATTDDMDALARRHPLGHRCRRARRGFGRSVAGHRVRRALCDARRGSRAGRRIEPARPESDGRRRRSRRRAVGRAPGRRGRARDGERRVPGARRRDGDASPRGGRHPGGCAGDPVRRPRPLRPRWRASTTRRFRACGAVRSSVRRTTSSARRPQPISSPTARCSTYRTSWPTPVASSTSPKSSSVTTGRAPWSALRRSRSPRPECSTPRRARAHAGAGRRGAGASAHRRRGSRPEVAARRPGRLDQRRPPHPVAPVAHPPIWRSSGAIIRLL